MITNFRIVLLLFAIGLSGCMNTYHLRVLRPADITLPKDIMTIAVANRSLAEGGWNMAGSIAEGILSGEGIYQDREGARHTVLGFIDAVSKGPRFKTAHTNKELMGGVFVPVFPVPLDWTTVEAICGETKSDALACLEIFDSDVSTTSKVDTVIEKKKDKEGKLTEVKKPVYSMSQRVDVTSGWRIYDPKRKTILDEFQSKQSINSEKSGKTPHQAVSGIPNQRSVVDNAGFVAGGGYAYRVSPNWVSVQRHYYNRAGGDERMKQAGRKAASGDWDSAAAAWQNVLQNGNKKAKKRASYNMILACEKQGKLDLALEWTQKAYSNYGSGNALNYRNIIIQRMNDEMRLNEQMP